jgi:hypothetical protein
MLLHFVHFVALLQCNMCRKAVYFVPPYVYRINVQSSDVPVLPFKQVYVVIRIWGFYVSEHLNCDAV